MCNLVTSPVCEFSTCESNCHLSGTSDQSSRCSACPDDATNEKEIPSAVPLLRLQSVKAIKTSVFAKWNSIREPQHGIRAKTHSMAKTSVSSTVFSHTHTHTHRPPHVQDMYLIAIDPATTPSSLVRKGVFPRSF